MNSRALVKTTHPGSYVTSRADPHGSALAGMYPGDPREHYRNTDPTFGHPNRERGYTPIEHADAVKDPLPLDELSEPQNDAYAPVIAYLISPRCRVRGHRTTYAAQQRLHNSKLAQLHPFQENVPQRPEWKRNKFPFYKKL